MITRSDTHNSHETTDHAPLQEPGVLRGVLSGVTTAVLVGLLLLVGAVVIIPKLLGGAGLTVLTGSMEPVYSPGDMVITVPQDSYAVGDVVTFQPISGDPTLITHRIVAYRHGDDGVSFVTRGDANAYDDQPIIEQQVMGKVLYHVPLVGHVALAFGEHRTTLVMVAGVVL